MNNHIDLSQAIESKINKNNKKYPIKKTKVVIKKYNEF